MRYFTLLALVKILFIVYISVPLSAAQKGKSKGKGKGKIKLPAGIWSSWTSSKCTVTCGEGTMRRRRKCLTGTCKGKSKSTVKCQNKTCEIDEAQWSPWEKFQACSVTCGNGTMVRTRTCSVRRKCKGQSSDTQTCTQPVCPVTVDESGFTTWSEYAKCSDTCGGGVQSRTRECLKELCTGHVMEVRNCKVKQCPGTETVSWGDFGPCSVTCGAGMKSRFKGAIQQQITCFSKCSKPETEYSPWSKYDKCSVSCGGGTQKRSRTCLKESCTEHTTEVQNCKMKICPASQCKNSLGSRCKRLKSSCGKRSIAKVCELTCKKCKTQESWTDYGPCSAKCGAGMKTRKKGSKTQSITCIGTNCTTADSVYTWSSWTDLGACSVTCGGGTMERARTCTEKNKCSGSEKETAQCQTQMCPDPIYTWTSWTDFSACSVSCGGGTMERTRTCTEKNKCSGLEKETSPCQTQICPVPISTWSSWTDFSACSMSCGGGTMERTRTCTESNKCSGSGKETARCQTQICPELDDWSPWSRCTKSCDTGMRLRARTCTVQGGCTSLPGDRSQVQSCNTQTCAEWTDWSAWSSCSVTCGGGKSVRTRSCTIAGQCGGLPGGASETVDCNTHICAEWGIWTSWTQCSASCGVGKRSRKRGCTVEWQCHLLEGDSEETEECSEGLCSGEVVEEWSSCSKSCGEGTRSRRNCTGNVCELEFEGCDVKTCADVSCRLESLFLKNRYGSGYECCRQARDVADANCGRPVVQKRVIGGVSAKEDQWPWMVAVQMTSGFCAGSLISENFVLSAAHCFAYDSGQPMNTTYWRIFAGLLRLQDVASAESYEISDSYIHPDYAFPVADIAVVKLKGSVTFGKIQPICLPSGEQTPFDSTCFVTGWGVSTTVGVITNELQELNILNFDPRVCIHAYGKHENLMEHLPFLRSNKGYVCAGSLVRPVDSCSGDSGGPLVCQRCNSCTWYIAGVVSFGPNPCAVGGVPGIYSSVLYYENWILQTTGLAKHSLSCTKA